MVDVGLNRPALVVVPDTEPVIMHTVYYAKNAGLIGSGSHGLFVPITDKRSLST